MKRRNFLFDRITDRGNIRLAFLKALRGNRSSLSAINYCRDIDKNLEALRGNLLSPNFRWGGYKSFLVTDPKPRPRAYCRYMDDFVAWSSSKKQLKDMFAQITDYVGGNLKLELKPPVFGDTDSGLPFLGFLVKENGVYLMQKSKRRARDRMAEISVSLGLGETTQEKAAERIRSVFAAIDMARTYRFRKKLCEKWGPAAGDNRVKRGGSWNNTPDNARSAIRNDNNPDNRNTNLGFRVVRS